MEKHNRLTLIRYSHKRNSHKYWLAVCDCGVSKAVDVYNVRTGLVKSCGCLAIESHVKHHSYKSRIYKIWHGMKQRCLNPNNPRWMSYGGRGIKICKEWMVFDNFLKDMGFPPDDKTLDRLDNDDHYRPSNCRWATRIEQQNNMRSNHLITYQGQTKNITQWATHLCINKSTLAKRFGRGWPVNRALSTKVIKKGQSNDKPVKD